MVPLFITRFTACPSLKFNFYQPCHLTDKIKIMAWIRPLAICRNRINHTLLKNILFSFFTWPACLSQKYTNELCIITQPISVRLSSLVLTHWRRVSHTCVGKYNIIGSDNGWSPERQKVIIWTSVVILLIGPLAINFRVISFGIQTFPFKKMHLKISHAK